MIVISLEVAFSVSVLKIIKCSLNCQLYQNCFYAEEVRELVRKRKQYEYKLQKRSKVKEDFLEYITYESNLLKLLEMRRESTGYQHKQAEIEGSIKTRYL